MRHRNYLHRLIAGPKEHDVWKARQHFPPVGSVGAPQSVGGRPITDLVKRTIDGGNEFDAKSHALGFVPLNCLSELLFGFGQKA
jgi:hypothetical protein